MSNLSKCGLFVGLVTLDFIYLAANSPGNNEKIVADDYTVAAGGPATNAAVCFSFLGNNSKLLGVIGNHPISQLIRSDLDSYHINILDLDAARIEPPPVSSIVVTKNTGDRAVVSINAIKSQINSENLPLQSLQNIDIVLIDGHQMEVGKQIAQLAKLENIPVVIDGGSWKLGFSELLPYIDYAICSDNFYPPNCHNSQDVFVYLSAMGIPHIAITRGEKSIEYLSNGHRGEIEISKIKPVDTLGAGDIFHGAFCHYILQLSFAEALAAAAKIAGYSCQFFGTRQWMRSKIS